MFTYMHNRVRMYLTNISRNLLSRFNKRTFGRENQIVPLNIYIDQNKNQINKSKIYVDNLIYDDGDIF